MGNVDSKLILLITFNIDVLISLCDSWWFIMETIMKYININISYYFFILFSMFCIPSRIILFNLLLIFSFIKHSNQKSIYWNEWDIECTFLNHEGIGKIWHAGQLSTLVGASSFTLLSLEAVAPFIVRYQTVLVCVTRIEECLRTLFILIKVDAPQLWLV